MSKVTIDIDIDAMLQACVPGGSVVDPQHVCDEIRAYCTALAQQDEQVRPVAWIVSLLGWQVQHGADYCELRWAADDADRPVDVPIMPPGAEDNPYDRQEPLYRAPKPMAVDYRRLIRDDFVARMLAAGHSGEGLTRGEDGQYLSAAVRAEWEAEKRKFAAPPAVQPFGYASEVAKIIRHARAGNVAGVESYASLLDDKLTPAHPETARYLRRVIAGDDGETVHHAAQQTQGEAGWWIVERTEAGEKRWPVSESDLMRLSLPERSATEKQTQGEAARHQASERAVVKLMAKLAVWLDEDQFNWADELMSPHFDPDATAQQTAVPLTDEQIQRMYTEHLWYDMGDFTWGACALIVRAVERAHGISAKEGSDAAE